MSMPPVDDDRDSAIVSIQSNTSLMARVLRRVKAQAIQAGKRDSVAVTTYMFKALMGYRGRLNDNTIWWMQCQRIAGNSREHEHDDDFFQGEFDFGEFPIKRYGSPEVKFSDGSKAVLQDKGWVVIQPDGTTTAAEKAKVPIYEATAKRPHIKTDIIPVREFGLVECDQRTRQMEENMDRAELAYQRWVKGMSLIRPLLVAHPTWTLGTAIDDLRDRAEWPDDLDIET